MNGIAHIQLTVRHFEECVNFYERLLPFFEMTLIYKGSDFLYYIGGRTGIAISRADKNFLEEPFDQRRPGLHHFCLRLCSKADVDELANFVASIGGTLIRTPQYNEEWAPGYYSLLFEDPDGLRIEANYVPGKGNLDQKIKLPKDWSMYETEKMRNKKI